MLPDFAALRGAAAILFFPVLCLAQTITGSIVGSVQDSSRAAVAGAQVAVTHADTGLVRETRTNERGDFALASLQAGEYSLAVHAPGFKSFESRALHLSSSETLTVGTVMLAPGDVRESVTVSEQPAAVQTASSERAGVITGEQIDNIQTLGRNVMDLITLLPGVVPDTRELDAPERSWRGNINGARYSAAGLTVDGMGLNQPGGNQNYLIAVGQNAISEVKVLMTNYQAEYGRFAGANIQVVSRSGTRSFHGMGSYFKRHEQFNATNFFNNRLGLDKARYRYNTWTYGIGGPVTIPGKFNTGREKLFFFWSQEFWPSKSATSGRTATVPTELERNGDFSQTLDLNGRAVRIVDPDSRVPFPENRVPSSRQDPNGRALLKMFPLPNFTDTAVSGRRYNEVFNSEASDPRWLGSLRVDYNLSSRHMLSGSFHIENEEASAFTGAVNPGTTWNQFYKTFRTTPRQLTVRYTAVISPSAVNEVTLGSNGRREKDSWTPEELARNQRTPAGFNVRQLYGSNNPLDIMPNVAFGAAVSNAAGLSYYGAMPLDSTRLAFVATDTFTKTTGPHVFKGGFSAERSYVFGGSGAATFNGEFSFATNGNNPLDSGHPYSNAILGVFNSYTESTTRFASSQWATYLEWFAQDSWKAARRLTLDIGVRFYWMPPRVTRYGNSSVFVPGRYDPAKAPRLIRPATVGGKRVGVHPTTGELYNVAAIGAIAPGVGDPWNGMVVPSRDGNYPTGLIDDPGVKPAPRFGFAWDPFGKGHTAVRGGFGIFFNRNDPAAGPLIQTPLIDDPIIYSATFTSLNAASSGLLFPQTVIALERDAKTATSYNMSFGVQQNIGYGTVVDASYVGTLGRHLMWARNLNAIPLGRQFDPAYFDPTTAGSPLIQQFLRPTIGYGDINYREWGSTSNFHSLQVAANRRFLRSVQYGVSWTWGKAMDYVDLDTQAVTTLISPRVYNYGRAGYDRTHVFKGNWLWSLPKSPWRAKAARWVLDDWQSSGIATFMSGAPLGITYSLVRAVNVTGTPSLTARVVMLKDPVLPKSERTFSRNFRTDAFAPPVQGTTGNAAKNVVRGPGLNNWDLTLIKQLPLRERVRMQFRCEFYNAFNHSQFTALDNAARFDVDGSQVNTRFSEFTAARNARVIQFALRLQF